MSRNKAYEQRQASDGLKKKTLWIPEELESEFEMVARACCENRDLSFSTLRSQSTGKYVSIERL
ncbi:MULTISPECIES: hypothetical protein [Vibrio]|uniref:Transposase n=1 Tax=Vibrio jasicida TaxID=766224 RepID=A0AAU9QGV1_9VIBR|nr:MULTISPECIES: hypothetical protein [Vibrio]CAH1564737.1 conserved hypothetical protein [Vibrio jasicida]CAH1573835.1 conserved hypothetical protein [Vibrio jasicida]